MSSNLDPSAWAIKYLIAASVSWFVCDWVMRGIKDRRLISSPAHNIIHWGDEIATKVPDISVVENSRVDGILESIRMGKELNLSKFRLEV